MLFATASDETKLKSLLDEYNKLAHQNPFELRLLIPSEEVWRFFIDGILQEKGRGLHMSAYFDEVLQTEGLFATHFLDYTIKEYAEKREKITIEQATDWDKSSLRKFLRQKQWHLTDEECELFTLRDILHLDTAWVPFEMNESGYLKALYAAFRETFDFSVSLNVEFIKRLHRLATTNVKEKSHQDNAGAIPGEFRSISAGCLLLTQANASVEGFIEFLKKQNTAVSFVITFFDPSNNKSIGKIKINRDSMMEIRKYLTGNANENEKNNELPFSRFCDSDDKEEFINKIKTDANILKILKALSDTSNEKELANCLHHLLTKPLFNNYRLSLESEQACHTQDTLTEVMTNLFIQYEQAMQKAISKIDKLHAIISLVQECEQCHPFIDANGRTFCMLLLNHLLMRNGFFPVILKDPTCFKLYSKKQLLAEVLDGMRNTLILINDKKLFNIDTQKILYLLQTKQLVDHIKYFKETVALEEEAREKHRKVYAP